MNQFSSKSKCRTTFPSKTKAAETFPTLSGPRKHSTQVFWTSGTQDFELCFDRTPVRDILILLCCEICYAVAYGYCWQQFVKGLTGTCVECFLGPESIGNVSAAFVLLGKVVRHFDFEENWFNQNSINKDHTWSVLYSMLGECTLKTHIVPNSKSCILTPFWQRKRSETYNLHQRKCFDEKRLC